MRLNCCTIYRILSGYIMEWVGNVLAQDFKMPHRTLQTALKILSTDNSPPATNLVCLQVHQPHSSRPSSQSCPWKSSTAPSLPISGTVSWTRWRQAWRWWRCQSWTTLWPILPIPSRGCYFGVHLVTGSFHYAMLKSAIGDPSCLLPSGTTSLPDMSPPHPTPIQSRNMPEKVQRCCF